LLYFSYYINSLTSLMVPVKAHAAAVIGLARNVLAPGPCLPSKFLLLVETQYLPAGILSSFIPRHAEQPAPRTSKPQSAKIVSNCSSSICFLTAADPGLTNTLIFFAFFLPFTIFAMLRKSSIREFVQLPKKT